MQKGPSCRAHFSAGPCSQGSESARSPSKTGLGTKARSSGGGQVCDSPWATVCAAVSGPPDANSFGEKPNLSDWCELRSQLWPRLLRNPRFAKGARVALHSNACKTQPRRISDFTTHSTPVLLLKHNCHSDFIAHTPGPFDPSRRRRKAHAALYHNEAPFRTSVHLALSPSTCRQSKPIPCPVAMQPLAYVEPLRIANQMYPPHQKSADLAVSPARVCSLHRAQPSARSPPPPHPPTPQGSSTRTVPATTKAASTASNRPLKKKTVSSNDDSLAARLQPKLTQSSWRRTKSYQHVDLSGPTPSYRARMATREVVFMILHLLSFQISTASPEPTNAYDRSSTQSHSARGASASPPSSTRNASTTRQSASKRTRSSTHPTPMLER